MRAKKILEAVGLRSTALTVLTGITGLYYLIVGVMNCVDTDTNRHGVAAVLSMRQTIHHPGVDWHAVSSTTVISIVYILIVTWELLISLVLMTAAVAWLRVLAGRALRDTAVRLSSAGWTMAVLLFLGGFLTIGGEWFRMWANEEVNASSVALQNFVVAAVGLILVHLPQGSIPADAEVYQHRASK